MIAENFHFHVMQDNIEIISLPCFLNLIFTDLKFILLCACARTVHATQDLSGGSILTEPQIVCIPVVTRTPAG